MSLTPEDTARRLANKRFNERAKLVALALNGGAIALIAGAIIGPAVRDPSLLLSVDTLLWLLGALVLHLFAHAALGLMRSED
jgi:hypothetical protein